MINYLQMSRCSSDEFFCLVRVSFGQHDYFKVLSVKTFGEVMMHNNHTSIVVIYCNTFENYVEQFQKMNNRFEFLHKSCFEVKYDLYMSFFNYLTKLKKIEKKAIWLNPRYQITSNNLEYFCDINYSSIDEIDDSSVITYITE